MVLVTNLRAFLLAAVLAAPMPGAAQASHQHIITQEWNAFTQFCAPFFRDFVAAGNALPRTGAGVSYSRLPDDEMLDYAVEDGERFLGVYFWTVNGLTDFHCDLQWTPDGGVGDFEGLNSALLSAIDQTPEVRASGGRVEHVEVPGFALEELGGDDWATYSYRLAGVFPGETTIFFASVAENGFFLSVHARFDAEMTAK
ncbi:MAG: hypothetical protein PVI41_01265 [Roseobacter sp.]|jgi:hypothetical protein